MAKKDKVISNQLLAFTFFYSVVIYGLMLVFCFRQWHKEMKTEE